MIYILNIFIELILGVVFLSVNSFDGAVISNDFAYKQKKRYSIICGVLWILISGLRGMSVGADTFAYQQSFQLVKSYPIGELFKDIYSKYFLGESIRDPGYPLMVKLFQYISGNYQVYLMCIAVFFMVPFTIWIIRESKNPAISFVLYSSLFYAFFSITGIRQTIATAMVVLLGDKFIKEKKLLPFVIITLAASTIHASALVFLPFYFISKIRIRISSLLGWSLCIVVSFLARHQLKSIFIQLSKYDDYTKDYEGAATVTFSTLLFLIFIWSLISYSRDPDIEDNRRFYNALYMALFFLPLTWLNPSAMRVVQYFSIYLVLLIPQMVEATFDEDSKRIASGIIIVILVLLLIKSNPQYTFFWQ